MIHAVIDTNILVSALLSPSGLPAKIFNHVLHGNVTMCFDSNIIAEYQEVLARPKFKFNSKAVAQILDFIVQTGISIIPEPLAIEFIDEADKVFYEVAVSVNGHLVTGNAKHYPQDAIVVTTQEFLEIVEHCKS